jgi:hypothetical protein
VPPAQEWPPPPPPRRPQPAAHPTLPPAPAPAGPDQLPGNAPGAAAPAMRGAPAPAPAVPAGSAARPDDTQLMQALHQLTACVQQVATEQRALSAACSAG